MLKSYNFSIILYCFSFTLNFSLYLKCISHSQHMIASWFLNPLLIIVALLFLFLGVFVSVQVNIYHMHTHRGQRAPLRERSPFPFLRQLSLFLHCTLQTGWHTSFQVFLHFPSPIEVLGLKMCAAVFGFFPGHPAFVASALTC